MRVIKFVLGILLLFTEPALPQYSTREPVNETAWKLFFRERALNPNFVQKINLSYPATVRNLPVGVTWQNTLGPIRDQGNCGSCWAFAVLGGLESALSRKTSTSQRRYVYDLSEQQLMDCSRRFGNMGCRGGFIRSTIRYLQRYPVCSETMYPYRARLLSTAKCRTLQKCISPIPRVTTIRQLRGEAQIQQALLNGPVIIAMHVNAELFSYASGVFDGTCNGVANHAVLLVGYNVTSTGVPFWIIRNSWGKDWGENGTLRIIRNRNQCRIGQYMAYQIM